MEKKVDLLQDLNAGQKKAVLHTKGPSIILAGAGSGKTRVLVSKVQYLIEECKVLPSSIVMITFTNKAAGEMKKRMKYHLGYVGTFHSFCAYILRRDGEALGIERSFSIYDRSDQESVIKGILKKKDSIKKYTPSYMLYQISLAKNQLLTPQKYQEVFSNYSAKFISEVYGAYQNELLNNQALDFDDLIMKTTTLLLKNPEILAKYQRYYQYFLVDEFQDTNYAQYVLTRILGLKLRNVTVVGDFSQSIYSWRGADIKNLEKFEQDFGGEEIVKTFHLEENYRSSQTILDFAYHVISQNQTHPILKLHTKNLQGEEITYYEADNEQDEALYISSEISRLNRDSYSSFSVLYRTNAQSRAIEEAFLHQGIPYMLIGGTRFYERKEIKDVLSYLRLIVNPKDSVAKERLLKLGKTRWNKFEIFLEKVDEDFRKKDTNSIIEIIFEKTGYLSLFHPDDLDDYARLENIKELKSVAVTFPNLVEFLEQVALVESEYFASEKKGNKDGVKLMTLHQAKGLEFPYVFIVGVEDGLLPHSQSIDDLFELEEERRLFYVGITRAEKKLYITYARRRFLLGRRNESVKSRFLE